MRKGVVGAPSHILEASHLMLTSLNSHSSIHAELGERMWAAEWRRHQHQMIRFQRQPASHYRLKATSLSLAQTDKLQAATLTKADCAMQMNRSAILKRLDKPLQHGTCLKGAQITYNSERATATARKKMHRNQ